MEIIRNLSVEKLRDLSLESDQRALQTSLQALKEWAEMATRRSNEDWEKQRVAIWSRLASNGRQSGVRFPAPVWALAALLLALASVLSNLPSDDGPRQAQADPDHELLLQVERTLQSEGPAALQPAALLAQEMVQDMRPAVSSDTSKEPRHEN